VHVQVYNLQTLKEEIKDGHIHQLQQNIFTLTSKLDTAKKEIESIREKLFMAEQKVYPYNYCIII